MCSAKCKPQDIVNYRPRDCGGHTRAEFWPWPKTRISRKPTDFSGHHLQNDMSRSPYNQALHARAAFCIGARARAMFLKEAPQKTRVGAFLKCVQRHVCKNTFAKDHARTPWRGRSPWAHFGRPFEAPISQTWTINHRKTISEDKSESMTREIVKAILPGNHQAQTI